MSNKKYDVITFGSATQDVFMSSRKFQVVEGENFVTKKGICVSLGSKILMDDVAFFVGGCGVNSAVTFARQGLKTAHAGMIGKDGNGQAVKEELKKHGVSTDLLKETDKWPTAFSVIVSHPDIGRSILKKLGACHQYTDKEVELDKLKAEWFYLGSLSSFSYKAFAPVVNFARENGIKVAANPVGDTQLSEGLEELRSLLNKLDILVVNQEEASLLTGIDYKKEDEIFDKLDEMMGGVAVMTKGPEGVVVSDGKNRYSAGIPESGMVDRTGAGDAFGSAFTAGYGEKRDIVHAIQLGTANATSVLQEFGATNGLLTKDEWGDWPKVDVEVK